MTLTLPPASGVTAPTPWSIVTLLAFVVVHRSMADPPDVIVVGSATRVAVGGETGDDPPTVTLAVALAAPAVPVAVRV